MPLPHARPSTVSGTAAGLAVNAGGNDNDSKAGIKLKGSHEKTVSTESKAVVGKLAAGGNIRIEGAQAATLEGTQVSAGGDVEIGSQGKLTVAAARDTTDSTRQKFSGGVELGGKRSDDPEKKSSEKSSSAGIEAAGEYEKTHAGTARTASVTAGGALRTRSGGDSAFEGTALKAGGKVEIDAGGDLAAHSVNKETHGAARLDASGGVALGSDGKASLVNAKVKGDAGTGIKAAAMERRTVGNTNATVNAGMSASRESSAPEKKKAGPASAQPFEKAVPAKAAPPSGIRIGERPARPAKAASTGAKATRPRSGAQARPPELASPLGG